MHESIKIVSVSAPRGYSTLPACSPCLGAWQVKKLERELTEAERKVVEGEALRKRLHNTIQVRLGTAGPALAEEATALGAHSCTVRPQNGSRQPCMGAQNRQGKPMSTESRAYQPSPLLCTNVSTSAGAQREHPCLCACASAGSERGS